MPNLDVMDDETRLHRTAVAQVFAFILQALHVGPLPLSWHDKAATLDTCAVEYDDVLRNIPATVHKEPAASPYKRSVGRASSAPPSGLALAATNRKLI